MIYVFLADGFEETEAIAPIDLLKRAGKNVIIAGVGGKNITGSHGITVSADITADEIVFDDSVEMAVLPGGMPGTVNLEADENVQKMLDFCAENGKYIGAICAAPSVLGHKGLLKGKKAVCYPGFESHLEGAEVCNLSVVADGNIITSRGAGTAVDFGLKLIEVVVSKDKSDEISKSIIYK